MRCLAECIHDMGVIEEIYDDLDADISLEDYREAVDERVEKMAGLADEETAAMLVAHELDDDGGAVDGIADIDAGMEEVQFVGKIVSVGEVRSFERDDAEADEGQVLNAELADETGQMRVVFWDAQARDASESLTTGTVLRIKGRPTEGYSGVEVNVTAVEPAPDVDIDVRVDDTYRIEELSLGRSNVNVAGRVLDTESVRTFDRDDGSEGRVSNFIIGDPTGRVRVTCWDGMAETVESLTAGQSVEIVDGYTRERDGDLEVHVGERGAVEPLEEAVEYDPDTTPIDAVELDQTVDLMGVVRSADPKRTFDRDDGSQGQVRNLRIQDDTGSIRIALWGDHADRDIGPGDAVAVTDVQIQDGWQDDLEASANWRSSVVPLDDDAVAAEFADDTSSSGEDAGVVLSSFEESETGPDETGDEATFTGVVVQPGDPVIVDDGEQTVTVETTADVGLGDEVTVHGEWLDDGRIDAADVSPT